MIFIVVKFPVKPEMAEQWPELTREFTEATRAEPGNKWFDWSRSLDDPNEYVLVEAFDDDAAEAHVKSDHFQAATAEGETDISHPTSTDTAAHVSAEEITHREKEEQ